MGYQVDFLCVGDKSRSGDAIAVRFGDPNNIAGQAVIVIDGGFRQSGKDLVEHIKTEFGTSTVDLVVSTHPDADHSSGLAVVLEEMKVGRLWMHQPWNHTDDIARMFQDGRVTDVGVAEGIRRSLNDVRDLEKIANRKGIAISEPFTGLSVGNTSGKLTVFGPTVEYYESLLPTFRCTPQPKDLGSTSLWEALLRGTAEAVRKFAEETLDVETLREPKGTHAENESSAVILLEVGDKKVLFTADVGQDGMNGALDACDASGISCGAFTVVQVPHHGSRRNVGPTLLNRLLGPKINPYVKKRTAVVSACPDGAPKHPSKMVTNAFHRRGAPVWGATGKTILFSDGWPRENWSSLESIPLHSSVDDYDD
jgi:beta-lactamase superfamily II metal-dependent hydrolase